ncbi:MAG: SAM-dependent methyltransferase [Archaeoglobaceae archaeon]|nr:SAM-dependent methyltransferase [Archaeoglobaceae archaeon]
MKVYFVGFGPGDKELLTIKARNLLEKADLIIYPGSIIEKEALEDFNGEKVDSQRMKLEEIVDLIEKAVRSGKIVVRLQSGDPSIFGAIWEQIRELKKKGIESEIVPGISSVFAASATLGIELTSPDLIGVAIVRPKGKTLREDYLEELAKLPITLVILLGANKADYIVEKVAKIRGFDEPCAVVYRASQKNEKKFFCKLGELQRRMEEDGIKKTAVIIIGKAVLGYEGRSYLYSGSML